MMGILTEAEVAEESAEWTTSLQLRAPLTSGKAGPKMLWRVTDEMSGMAGWLRRMAAAAAAFRCLLEPEEEPFSADKTLGGRKTLFGLEDVC